MDIFEAFVYGLFLGIATALSPGPFIALVLAEALDGKLKNAIVISFTPLLTDIPIIIFSFTFLKNVLTESRFLAFISSLGGIFLVYYGISHIKTGRFSYVRETGKVEEPEDIPGSIWKGVVVNILSPYTYIFWLVIATGFLAKSDFVSGFTFVAAFFVGLIGSSLMVAFLVYRGRAFLSSRILVYITQFLGFMLVLFGVRLFYESLKLTGII